MENPHYRSLTLEERYGLVPVGNFKDTSPVNCCKPIIAPKLNIGAFPKYTKAIENFQLGGIDCSSNVETQKMINDAKRKINYATVATVLVGIAVVSAMVYILIEKRSKVKNNRENNKRLNQK